ncbi:hypothetical protein [Microvirus sp.]|nr:hypothetical protein [Microvirus sp.]
MSSKKSFFEMMYPCPRDLLRPFLDVEGRRRYDFCTDIFALFNFTFCGCQVVIRPVYDRYHVCVRGWLPRFGDVRKKQDLVRFDDSWSVISVRKYLSDAVVDFRSLCKELLTLDDEQLKVFNRIGLLA